MKTNALLASLSEYFISYLPDVKGFSSNTITSYQYAFQLLFDFLYEEKGLLPEKTTFSSLSSEIILEFLTWLEIKRGCSPTTRNLRRAAISSFAKYALKNNFSDALQFYSNVTEIPKKNTPKDSDIKYFTKEEISILLNAPNTKRLIGKRDAMLLSLLYASGARAQEMCDLTLNDIYFGVGTNIRLVGKGNKARLVTIPENCAVMLKNYLTSKKLDVSSEKDRSRHVFSSQTHEKTTISCIEAIVAKYVAKSKETHPHLFRRKTYSPHSFRHSIAVHMLECGESIGVIKAFLGHSSITTTTVYASVTPELANKYLRERGKALENIKLGQPTIEHEHANAALLPFLVKRNQKSYA
jgi:site-specific recombinase XerD